MNKTPRELRIVAAVLALMYAGSAEAQDMPERPPGVIGTKDHRVPVGSNAWPWSSIGIVNTTMGIGRRGTCTGTLIGPRQVVTAAHCLFNLVQKRWAKPHEVHFLAGYDRGTFQAHSTAATLIVGPGHSVDTTFTSQDVSRDWAVVILQDTVALRPVDWHVIAPQELTSALDGAELIRAGYGRDRAHVLRMHKGCLVKADARLPSVLLHSCDAAEGDSGGPLLLVKGNSPVIIGINTGFASRGLAKVGLGVSAAAFDAAARAAVRGP